MRFLFNDHLRAGDGVGDLTPSETKLYCRLAELAIDDALRGRIVPYGEVLPNPRVRGWTLTPFYADGAFAGWSLHRQGWYVLLGFGEADALEAPDPDRPETLAEAVPRPDRIVAAGMGRRPPKGWGRLDRVGFGDADELDLLVCYHRRAVDRFNRGLTPRVECRDFVFLESEEPRGLVVAYPNRQRFVELRTHRGWRYASRRWAGELVPLWPGDVTGVAAFHRVAISAAWIEEGAA